MDSREALVDAAGGFLLPLVIAIVIQDGWNDKQKTIASALILLLWAAIRTIYVKGAPTSLEAWIETLLISAVFCWTSYRNFWRSLGIAPALQTATTLKYPPKPAQ